MRRLYFILFLFLFIGCETYNITISKLTPPDTIQYNFEDDILKIYSDTSKIEIIFKIPTKIYKIKTHKNGDIITYKIYYDDPKHSPLIIRGANIDF